MLVLSRQLRFAMHFFCTALSSLLQGSNPDELSLKEGELIELIADGDGDGWVRVSLAVFVKKTPHLNWQ